MGKREGWKMRTVFLIAELSFSHAGKGGKMERRRMTECTRSQKREVVAMLSSGHGSALNSTPVSTETRASFLLSSIVCVSIHARMFTVHIHACTQIFVNSPIRWNYCVHLSIFNAPESWVMPLAAPSHASTSLFLSYAEKDASLQYVTLRLNISMTTHCWSINLWLVSASSRTSDVMLPSILWPPDFTASWLGS